MGRAIGVSLRPAAGQGRPGSGPGTTRVRREGARRGRAPAIGGALGSRGRAVPVIRAAPRDGRPEGAGLGRAEAAGLGVPGRAPTYLIGAGCGRSRAGRRDAGWWVGVPRRAGPLAAAGARIGGSRALSGPWPSARGLRVSRSLGCGALGTPSPSPAPPSDHPPGPCHRPPDPQPPDTGVPHRRRPPNPTFHPPPQNKKKSKKSKKFPPPSRPPSCPPPPAPGPASRRGPFNCGLTDGAPGQWEAALAPAEPETPPPRGMGGAARAESGGVASPPGRGQWARGVRRGGRGQAGDDVTRERARGVDPPPPPPLLSRDPGSRRPRAGLQAGLA